MSRKTKLLLTLVVISALGAVAGFATWSAFSSTTSNSGNNFDAGTVQLTDNDGGSYLYNVTNRKPGDQQQKCIKVTYGGTLDAHVRLYIPETVQDSQLGDNASLTVEAGTSTSSTFPNCGTFTSTATVYNGKLSGFPHTWGTASATEFNPSAGGTKWAASDAVVYRVTISMDDTNAANKGNAVGYTPGAAGYQSGAHTFTWEAQNL